MRSDSLHKTLWDFAQVSWISRTGEEWHGWFRAWVRGQQTGFFCLFLSLFRKYISLGHIYIHSFLYCLWQLSMYNRGLNNSNSDYMTQKSQKCLQTGHLQKKVADSRFRNSNQTHKSCFLCLFLSAFLSPSTTHHAHSQFFSLVRVSTWPYRHLWISPISFTKSLRLGEARVNSQTIS